MIQGKFAAIGFTHRLPRVREGGLFLFSFILHSFLSSSFNLSPCLPPQGQAWERE